MQRIPFKQQIKQLMHYEHRQGFIEWHNYPNMACYNDVSCNSTEKVIELTGCVWKEK